MAQDRFGNTLDPALGYAWGSIIRNPLDEFRRRTHGMNKIRQRVASHGRGQLFNFTGHRRDFLARETDLSEELAEEWVGTPLIEDQFSELSRNHFGADGGSVSALFNRSAAGIVATLLTLASQGDRVVAVAPLQRTHPSVRRGAALAGAQLKELNPEEGLPPSLFEEAVLIVLTRVTSELDVMHPDQVQAVVDMAGKAGCPLFIDDAYGSRVGPALLGHQKTLAVGADFGITSCDKAGLGGPRAGLMVGRADLVNRVVATASGLGLEARGPLILGVLRSLEGYNPDTLRRDSALAREIAIVLQERFGADRVLDLCMGPTISEEDVLTIALEGQNDKASLYGLVPAEAACMLGMILLVDDGFVTSNVAERPGARVSLRLRPTAAEVDRFGGPKMVVDAVDAGFQKLRTLLGEPQTAREIIYGSATDERTVGV